MYGTVAQIKSEEHTSQRSIYNGFFGLFGNRRRHMRTLEKRLEDMEDSMRLEQSSLPEKVCAYFLHAFSEDVQHKIDLMLLVQGVV